MRASNESWRFANAPRKGMQFFTVWGKNYGISSYSISSRLGYTTCASSAWMSDTTLTCRLAAGIPPGQAVTLTLGEPAGPRVSTQGLMWSYNQPSIREIGTLLDDASMVLYAGNAPRLSVAVHVNVSESLYDGSIHVHGASYGPLGFFCWYTIRRYSC